MALSLTRHALVDAVQMSDCLYMANGVDSPWLTDGLATGRLEATVGTAQPATAVTLGSSADAAALVDGTYQVLVTYYRQAGTTYPEMESAANETPTSITLSGGPKQIDVTDIPLSPDGQIDGRRLYIYGGNITRWRLALDIANNTAEVGTLEENVAYYNKQAVLREATGDLPRKRTTLPPAFSHLAVHLNRLWGINGETAYWSQPQPYHEDFPFGQALKIPVSGGIAEKLTGIKSFRESLVVFREDAVYGINGSSDTTFDPELLVEGYGTPSGLSIVAHGGFLYWLDRQHGVVRWSGGPKPENVGAGGEANILEDFWGRLDQNRLRESTGKYSPTTNEIIWLVTEGRLDRHNRAIVYDLTTNTLTVDVIAGNSMGLIRNEVGKKYILMGNTLGDVQQYNIGNLDAVYEGTVTGTIAIADGKKLTCTGAVFGDASDIEGGTAVLLDTNGDLLAENWIVDRVGDTELELLYPIPSGAVTFHLGANVVSRETPWMRFDGEGPAILKHVWVSYTQGSGTTVYVSKKKPGGAWSLVGSFTDDGDGLEKLVTTRRSEYHKLKFWWINTGDDVSINGYTAKAIPTRGR